MGLLLSQIEHQQFMTMIKAARDAGCLDSKIAKELRVPYGKVKHLATGLMMPSPKHVDRLNELVRSSPLKSIPPPAPIAINISPTEKALPTICRFLQEGHEVPIPEKERADMDATEVNGATKNPEAEKAAHNARYQRLTLKESKPLRRAMKETLASKFQGNHQEMAKVLEMTAEGLLRALTKTNCCISRLTLQRYSALTGYRGNETIPLPTRSRKRSTSKQAHLEEPSSSKNHLSPKENKELQIEMRAEVHRLDDNIAELARLMEINRGTLSAIFNGGGSTYGTRDRFQQYMRGKTTTTSTRSTTNGSPHPPGPVHPAVTPHGPTCDPDFWNMAGHECGENPPLAVLYGRIAVALEKGVPLEAISQAIADVTPPKQHPS